MYLTTREAILYATDKMLISKSRYHAQEITTGLITYYNIVFWFLFSGVNDNV